MASTLEGPAGRAHHLDVKKAIASGDVDATPNVDKIVALWFLDLPGGHTIMQWWALVVTRAWVNGKPGHKLTLVGVNPELYLDPNNVTFDPTRLSTFEPYPPAEVHIDLPNLDDARAEKVIQWVLQGVLKQDLKPDRDTMDHWKEFVKTAVEYQH